MLACESALMVQTVCVLLNTPDRQRLEAIMLDRNRQRKHSERARVILTSAGGGPVQLRPLCLILPDTVARGELRPLRDPASAITESEEPVLT